MATYIFLNINDLTHPSFEVSVFSTMLNRGVPQLSGRSATPVNSRSASAPTSGSGSVVLNNTTTALLACITQGPHAGASIVGAGEASGGIASGLVSREMETAAALSSKGNQNRTPRSPRPTAIVIVPLREIDGVA